MSIFFTKTAIGHSHIAAGTCCQDYSAGYRDEERTVVTACDGHGGKVYIRSHLGAKFASDAAIDVLRSLEKTAFYKNKKETVAEGLRLNILCRWNALVESHMAKKPIRASEYAKLNQTEAQSLKKNPFKAYGSTLNAAMILGNKLITVALGDGGCFLLKGGSCVLPFPEDEDEPVANITYSLCQDEAYSHLQVAIHELSDYDGAIVCTDGMLNPYANLENFSRSLVLPTMANLLRGEGGKLAEFVTEMGAKLGNGDDVSLGILIKDNLSKRRILTNPFQNAKI